MPLVAGQVLNNRYRIAKLLGQGGFGAVYRAWDLTMAAVCAVKENLDTSPAARQQFEREAKLLFRLHHPNLPRVYDHFLALNQGQYLVMDFVEGQNLQDMLDLGGRGRAPGAPLPEAQVVAWIGQVADALGYMHRQNPPVIHRDVKPANIIITPQGEAILVDFGISKSYDPNVKTSTAARSVTPGYSPQEQYTGTGTGPYSDVYALGATVYTLLTGVQPPESVSRNLGAVLRAPRALNRAVSPQAESAILKAMAMLPGDRFQSAAEFAATLRPAPRPAPQPAPAPPPLPPAPPVTPASSAANRPRWFWLAWIAVLTVLFVLAALLNRAGNPPSPQATSTQEPATMVAVVIPTDTLFIPSYTLPPPTPTWTSTPSPYPTASSTPTLSPSPTATPTPTATLYPRAAILSFHGRYVTAKGEADGWVLRQETGLDDPCGWFTLSPQADGSVALLTCQQRFVTAPETGTERADWLLRQEAEPGRCAMFTIHDLGNGEVAFESCSGRYITAGDGNWSAGLAWLLVAETTQVLDWERFKLQPP